MKFRYRLERSRILPGTGTFQLFEAPEKDLVGEWRENRVRQLDLRALAELTLSISGYADKTVLKRAIVSVSGTERFVEVISVEVCPHPSHEMTDPPEGFKCPACNADVVP